MPPRSNSPICERSLDLTLIEIGRRDIPQCSPKHFFTQMFYRTFSGGQRPRTRTDVHVFATAGDPPVGRKRRRHCFAPTAGEARLPVEPRTGGPAGGGV